MFQKSLLKNFIKSFDTPDDRKIIQLTAEDRGLIPVNSIDTIIKQYEDTHKWGDDTFFMIFIKSKYP